MDSLGFTRLPGPVLAAFPPFLVRAPWWGGDLQTLRNYLMRWSVPLLSAERIYLPMRDGSGDRLVGSLHRPPPASGPAPARPLVVLIHGPSGRAPGPFLVQEGGPLRALGVP